MTMREANNVGGKRRSPVRRILGIFGLGAVLISLGLVAVPTSSTAAPLPAIGLNDPGSDTPPEGSSDSEPVDVDAPDGGAGSAPEGSEDPSSDTPEEVEEQPETTADAIMPLSALAFGQVADPASWSERPATRLGGEDRYATAAAITRQAYPSTADTVIVATGELFSDSLSAAPLSAKLRAPLLPVARNEIPAAIKSELTRLMPSTIIIAGGPGSVSPQVESELRQYAASVVRLSGSDRYTTSVEIAKFGWPEGTQNVFVATGEGFADALSAGAAAAKLDAPVLLVPGSGAVLPQELQNGLSSLGATRAHIVGGPATVSPSIESAIGALAGAVTRYSGKDRYEVSANVSTAIFGGYADVYWANGLAFADALAGAAAAGARGSALLLVESGCVPSVVYAATDRLLPGEILILGGAGTLSDSVRNGNECMIRPSGISDSDWISAQALYGRVNQDRFERGLGALRVSDSRRGNPAQSWAAQIAQGQARSQASLSSAEPWVRYQVSAVTGATTSNRVQRSYDLLRSYRATGQWLYQPNAGVRGFVSVGYATSGSRSSAVLFFGAGLDG